MPSFGGQLGPKPGSRKRSTKLNITGLGRSLVSKSSKKKDGASSDRYTTDITPNEPSWVKLQSKTQERPLDEFLSTAELADTDFTTERTANIRIIQSGGQVVDNPYVLSEEQKQNLVQRHYENAGKLTVPRRPQWNKDMTAFELDRLEKDAFLNWRRSLAELQDNQDLLLTPFERNIEVWRQLWRVVERSDLVVQIVDARNPLLFRSIDLDKYVTEVDNHKRTLLLINKADMLNEEQRKIWADYFKSRGIEFAFFSAKAALTEQEHDSTESEPDSDESESGPDSDESRSGSDSDSKESEPDSDRKEQKNKTSSGKDEEQSADQGANDGNVESQTSQGRVAANTTNVLTVDQLERLFIASAPSPANGKQLQIGLVGYPNVGKSSTINALIGAKKVSVSATPGKTKHFQTIQLSPEIMLCDCPGLVFPNFAQTNGDLVCNGVLPIDQLREFTGPSELICQRIPKYFLEAVYGIKVHTKPLDEGGTGQPTALELLNSYAGARGYWRTGGGDPDISRAARYILKDYVNGKLLYCEPPPGAEAGFNKGKYSLDTLGDHRRQQIMDAIRSAHPNESVDFSNVDLQKEMQRLKFSSFDSTGTSSTRSTRHQPTAGSELDKEFFKDDRVDKVSTLPFHLQKLQSGNSKKHFKGRGKKAK